MGQTARDLIKYRMQKNGSMVTNFAAVTLVFDDERYTTAWAMAGGTAPPPFNHSEARALGNCVVKSIQENIGVFTHIDNVGENTGSDEYPHKLEGWKEGLKKLKKIIIVSDRSPCNWNRNGISCEDFFKKLAKEIEPIEIEIFYNTQYSKGTQLNFDEFKNPISFIEDRNRSFKENEDAIILNRQTIETEIESQKLSESEIQLIKGNYNQFIETLEKKFNEDFFIEGSYRSSEQIEFDHLKNENIQALNNYLTLKSESTQEKVPSFGNPQTGINFQYDSIFQFTKIKNTHLAYDLKFRLEQDGFPGKIEITDNKNSTVKVTIFTDRSSLTDTVKKFKKLDDP